MNIGYTEHLRMNNTTTDFLYMWTLSAGEVEPPQSGASLLPCGVSTFSLIPLESPHFTTIN